MKNKLLMTGVVIFCLLVGSFFAWEAGLFWDKSFKKTYKLAKQWDEFAQFEVGCIFTPGNISKKIGVRKNKKKAILWLNKAAKQGNPLIQYLVGQIYRDELSNCPKAIYWLTKAARAGYLDAQRILGNGYNSGYGCQEKDLAKAIYWLTKAAVQGADLEQWELGKIYYDGEEDYQNDKKALYWLSKAAQNGHSRAQYLLGNMYYDGIATKRNRITAAFWWREAAKQLHLDASYNLGLLYYDGTGVKQDYKQSYIWSGLASKILRFGSEKTTEQAQKLRDLSKQKLSPLQLVEAEETLNMVWDDYLSSL